MINSDKLKDLMREKHITQSDVAVHLNKKSCTISQKINNKRAMYLEEAEAIANFLGIKDSEFRTYFFNSSVA